MAGNRQGKKVGRSLQLLKQHQEFINKASKQTVADVPLKTTFKWRELQLLNADEMAAVDLHAKYRKAYASPKTEPTEPR